MTDVDRRATETADLVGAAVVDGTPFVVANAAVVWLVQKLSWWYSRC